METTQSKNRQESAQFPTDMYSLPESCPGDLHPLQDFREYAVSYARQQPEMAALMCLGLGFVLGWKLKPW